jgi:hypothetical protein
MNCALDDFGHHPLPDEFAPVSVTGSAKLSHVRVSKRSKELTSFRCSESKKAESKIKRREITKNLI